MGKDKSGIDQQNQIEDEYGVKEDGTIETNGVHVRHVNRNEDKNRERTQPDGRRGSIARSQEDLATNKPEHNSHVRASGNTFPDFFVLILSKKKAKFFRADASGLRHIEISELPNGIEDVVHLEEKDSRNTFRPGSMGGGNHHGMGAGVPTDKENISMYLKEVDKTLWTSGLNKSNAPLVLGGVEYIVSIYKEISQYKHIMEKCVCGSVENEDPKVIYNKAMEIINPTVAV